MGTLVGVRSLSGSVWVFTDPDGVGVEAAEELLKATGVCETVRALSAGLEVCKEQTEERPLSGLMQGRTDMKGPGEERRKAGVRGAEHLTPVGCLFLRRAGERVRRWSSHNTTGCGLSLCKCPPCVHRDIRIKSRIV